MRLRLLLPLLAAGTLAAGCGDRPPAPVTAPSPAPVTTEPTGSPWNDGPPADPEALNPTTDAADTPFAQRLSDACLAGSRRLAAQAQFPVDTFDPEHPTAVQLRQVGAWLQANTVPAYRETRDSLNRLGTPPKNAAGFAELRTRYSRLVDAVSAEASAATAGDTAAFHRSSAAVDAAVGGVQSAAVEFGAPACAVS